MLIRVCMTVVVTFVTRELDVTTLIHPLLSSLVMDGPLSDSKISEKSENNLKNSVTESSRKITTIFNKYILYENRAKFFIVASNASETRHRILKIDRTTQDDLSIVEDATEYSGKYMNSTLKTLEEANRPFGGLGRGRVFFGLVGKCAINLIPSITLRRFERLHTVYGRMVYDYHLKAVCSRAPWWPLLIPLRNDRNDTRLRQPQDREAC